MLGHLVLQLCAIVLTHASLATTGVPFQFGPPTSDGPVVVRAGFFLHDVNNVDEELGTFELEGILTLRWSDERLAFDPAESTYSSTTRATPSSFSMRISTDWILTTGRKFSA